MRNGLQDLCFGDSAVQATPAVLDEKALGEESCEPQQYSRGRYGRPGRGQPGPGKPWPSWSRVFPCDPYALPYRNIYYPAGPFGPRIELCPYVPLSLGPRF